MNIEDIDLPYAYADNTRAGSLTYVVASLAISAILLGVKLLLWSTLPWLVVAAPIGLVAFRGVMHLILFNAFHEALRAADRDAYLDEYIQQSQERHVAMVTPESFAQSISEAIH